MSWIWYVTIAESKGSIGKIVNLIGVVTETTIPRPSKGTDFFCTVTIVDDSTSILKLPITIFAEELTKLPCLDLVGDIFQVSRVKLEKYDGRVCASFIKRFSHFALYKGGASKVFVPYQSSFMNFSPSDRDMQIIYRLRKWSAWKQIVGGVSLKEIRGGELSVMCKVLHICGVGDGSYVVYVWDGTDTPPNPIETSMEKEKGNPLPLQLEPFTLSRDVLCTFPSVGTVLRVIIDQQKYKFDLSFLRTGKWMVMVDINFDIDAGLWRGMLMGYTRLRFLSDEDPLIIPLQRDNDKRVPSKWGRMPLSSLPWCSRTTETDHRDVPFATLMDILTHEEVTANFRCVVRVVAVCPWRVKDFRSPRGIFRIRLTLEDPTARIHAYLYAEDGDKFFGRNASTEVLKKMRNKLLGVAVTDDGEQIQGASRNPSWVDCCIFSYYQNKDDIWGSRQYRIFDTKVARY